MLQFEVHDPQVGSPSELAARAYLLGRDDQPVGGGVKVRQGRLVCQPEDGEATALCLEVSAGPMGRMMLQTCLLPQRPEPYRLNLELARHRIKMYIAKGEEWLLFDPVRGGDSFKIWERARTLFVQAINDPDPASAEARARDSLVAAIEAGERLALMQAEQNLQRRYKTRAASSTLVGVRADPTGALERSGTTAAGFDVLAVETPWSLIEPSPGVFRFDAVDRWMTMAAQARRPIVAGPLLRFDDAWLPQWMQVHRGDYKAIMDRSYMFMEQLVHRYRAVATLWNLASGLHTNAWHAFQDSERVDLARRAAVLARQSRKGARTLVELTDPFGECVSRNAGAITAWQFLERLIQEGVHLDAVGLTLRLGDGGPGFGVRDLLQLSAVLDRFAGYECKVMISAFGVPSEPVEGGGQWRKPWSDPVQAQWATSVTTIALSKPFVETLVWERLEDGASGTRARCGLLDASAQPKTVARKLLAIRNRLRKPLGAPAPESTPESAAAPDPATDETAAGAPPA